MRIFNEKGEKLYQEWVLKFCAKETKGQGEVPYHLLESSETSTNLYGTDTPDRNHWNGPCPNKYEMISYLKPFIDECLPHVSQNMAEQRRVWDSFALHFFEHICPKDESERYLPKKFEQYMINNEGRGLRETAYRHRIYGPYRFAVSNFSAIRPFFEANASCVTGDFEEQIGSHQEFVCNSEFLLLLNRLYTANGRQMEGFIVKAVPIDKNRPKWIKKCKPGSLRRLVSVSNQLKNNFDFGQCTAGQMLEMLGGEFQEWIIKKDKKAISERLFLR